MRSESSAANVRAAEGRVHDAAGAGKAGGPGAPSQRLAAESPSDELPRSAIMPSDYYLALLQQVRLKSGTDAPLTVGVTSCRRGEGVSTVATNLALAAARMHDAPVLLVDANCRWMGGERRLQMPGAYGLSDLLDGRAPIGECLHSTDVEGLSVMPAGDSATSLAAACLPARLEPLIEQFKSEFEMIVFDLPPVDELRSAAALASALDGLLLVVEAGRTRRIEAAQAQQRLKSWQAKLLGIVINKQRG